MPAIETNQTSTDRSTCTTSATWKKSIPGMSFAMYGVRASTSRIENRPAPISAANAEEQPPGAIVRCSVEGTARSKRSSVGANAPPKKAGRPAQQRFRASSDHLSLVLDEVDENHLPGFTSTLRSFSWLKPFTRTSSLNCTRMSCSPAESACGSSRWRRRRAAGRPSGTPCRTAICRRARRAPAPVSAGRWQSISSRNCAAAWPALPACAAAVGGDLPGMAEGQPQ